MVIRFYGHATEKLLLLLLHRCAGIYVRIPASGIMWGRKCKSNSTRRTTLDGKKREEEREEMSRCFSSHENSQMLLKNEKSRGREHSEFTSPLVQVAPVPERTSPLLILLTVVTMIAIVSALVLEEEEKRLPTVGRGCKVTPRRWKLIWNQLAELFPLHNLLISCLIEGGFAVIGLPS